MSLAFRIRGLKDIVDEFQLDKSQFASMKQSVLDAATQAVVEAWKKEARKSLTSTRDQYIRSIGVVNEGRYRNAIVLNGQMPNMQESGSSAFDMKEGFSKSPKAKRTAKGGWYLHIPFRYATPGSLGESSVFSGVLPSSVFALVKSFSSKSDNSKGTGKTDSLKSTDLPEGYGGKGTRAGFSSVSNKKTFSEYIHKSSQYEGLMKSNNTYEKATQGQYHTIRTVSSNSDPNAWVHPGFTALNLAEAALANAKLDIVVNNSIDFYLSKL